MITECRSCYSKNLTNILSLGNFFLSDFTKGNKKPRSYPLTIVLCSNCLLLQLKHTTPAKYLYTEHYGYRSGINNMMQKELKEIVQKSLQKRQTKQKKLHVVDIGANDGTLLRFYPKFFEKTGFEPIKKLAKLCEKQAKTVINDFFNVKAYKKVLGEEKADIITAISCFYDMEEPNTFVDDVTDILKDDGIFVIQQNYLKSMLEQNAFDNIVHEHLEYYSLFSLQNLLQRHNLEVFDLEFSNINGGSLRTYIAFKGKRKITHAVTMLQKEEQKIGLDKKEIYITFAENVKEIGKQIRSFIKQQVKKGKKVYVYGASTRGNTLLQYFKLDNSLLSYAVERNEEKWGTKIASLGIPIISEEQARKEKPDYMLVLPWFFKEEFMRREKNYLKNGGHFIFPLPQFEII